MATSATPTIPRNELNFVKLIGEGGFSSVYQMTWMHPSLGPIDIAAKKLNRRDITELNIMSDLDHPNIVKLLGVVDEPIDFMLILELCDKGSLRSYLKNLNGQRLSDDQFRDWAEQAARSLGYLREKDIVHKDVKSPNYMITADNNLKLGDFGIAKNIAHTIYNATTSASYPWMAPELLRDGVLSPKYDIFAYGVIVWELRTGKCPFEGLEFQVVAWRVCHENQRLPIPEDCPQPIKDLMMRCWETDWRKRPDIEEVIAMIRRAAEVQAAEALPSSASAVASFTSSASALATAPSVNSTAKQILRGPWILEREIGIKGDPQSIAVNPINSDIAVTTDTPNAHIFNINGDYKFTLDSTHNRQQLQLGQGSEPWDVAVNSQGNSYFVTDAISGHVKCFDSGGQPKGQWVSSCPQPLFPTCPEPKGITIDYDGHVLVGYLMNKYINKYKQDGTYLSSIKVELFTNYIAVTTLGTIVVAEENEPPQIVSSAGHVMCTLKHPVDDVLWHQQGVYTHEDIILIANRTDTDSILCYSTSGNYLGTLPISDISSLGGIALTADGRKLMVCQYRSVKVFKLV